MDDKLLLARTLDVAQKKWKFIFPLKLIIFA